MANHPPMLELLEEILNSEKTPEEVCRDYPELLPEVRRRWQQFQVIDEHVRSLLPGIAPSQPIQDSPTSEVAVAPPTAFGRYVVQRPLGSGGFGDVYLAYDAQLDRPVAVKVLRSGKIQKRNHEEQLLQEARRWAPLRHPEIFTVNT